jgi:general secretion pathway protein E
MEISPSKRNDLRSLAATESGMILFAGENRGNRLRFLDLFLDESKKAGRNVLLLGDGIGGRGAHFPRAPLPEGSPEELDMVITALLNHNPDLIALADITGSRAFLTAWRGAQRGLLVVAGIDSAALGPAFDYLIHARRENRSVAAGLRGIMAVTAVRMLCPCCREVCDASAADAGLPAAETLYRSPGCPECGYSGSGGTRYLADVVPFDRDLREAFAESRESSGILRRLTGRGYRSIAEELDDLLLAGEISPEEYFAATAR